MVIDDVPATRPRKVVVRCDCGTEKIVFYGNMKRGQSTSCGCRNREAIAERNKVLKQGTRHGLHNHPHYRRWAGMMERCSNPKHPKYHRYGGRGITVAPEWHDVTTFIRYLDEVLGPKPEGSTMDRIDNSLGYQPGNIRWATISEQNSNRSRYKRQASRGGDAI